MDIFSPGLFIFLDAERCGWPLYYFLDVSSSLYFGAFDPIP
jgi:hypothetical protein